jgi:hypothetical protein
MPMLSQLVKRGWRVVTEVHTTQWLIVDVLGALIPSSISTAIVAFLGEHSVAVLATVFFLVLAASALVVLALLGFLKEKAPPALAPNGGRISLMEAATRACEQTRNRPVARFAEMPVSRRFLNESNDQILTWYCNYMTRPRDDGRPPRVTLWGKRPPSRLDERLDALSNYDFEVENGAIVLRERMGNVRYQDLTVASSEVNAAIREMAEFEVRS